MTHMLIVALKGISRLPHKLLDVFNYIQIWSICKNLAASWACKLPQCEDWVFHMWLVIMNADLIGEPK